MDYTRLEVPVFNDNQSSKDIKKQTPDYILSSNKTRTQIGFRTKDKVFVNSICLVNKIRINGDLIFDSYDKYDNTCYVQKGIKTYNVKLTDIKLIPKNK
jgi:hypothetical protein